MKERKMHRRRPFCDACVVEEGIIAGGGTAYIDIIDELQLLDTTEGDSNTGSILFSEHSRSLFADRNQQRLTAAWSCERVKTLDKGIGLTSSPKNMLIWLMPVLWIQQSNALSSAKRCIDCIGATHDRSSRGRYSEARTGDATSRRDVLIHSP